MKISVIVPVYNVEDYLEKCLTSIVEQNFQDYEIIIVNDGTTDNSEKIIENFIEKYSEKIIYIKQENKGLGGARNTGICHAKGEYLMFVDSDDYIAPNMLQVAYDKILSERADLLIFDFYLVSESYEVLNCKYSGMEFATEMIGRASMKGQVISQVPVKLYCDQRGRPSHLRSIRDGMRHLAVIVTKCRI